MRTKFAVLLTGLGLLFLAVPVVAHHAVGAEYDASKPLKLTGTVTKVEFTNPHARMYFDVKQPDGTVVNWHVEMNARSILVRQGWTAKTLNIGETVTVVGHAARAANVYGINVQADGTSITTADGRKVFVAPE
jgi:DNA/RNA endonuclease YhcR with UshA esterase domain